MGKHPSNCAKCEQYSRLDLTCNLPTKVMKWIAENKPEYALGVYNKLARSDEFPNEWNVAKLVLLKKGDKPDEYPPAHRPICLNLEEKLCEHLQWRPPGVTIIGFVDDIAMDVTAKTEYDLMSVANRSLGKIKFKSS